MKKELLLLSALSLLLVACEQQGTTQEDRCDTVIIMENEGFSYYYQRATHTFTCGDYGRCCHLQNSLLTGKCTKAYCYYKDYPSNNTTTEQNTDFVGGPYEWLVWIPIIGAIVYFNYKKKKKSTSSKEQE